MSGFSLYIHWPFCLSKCPYCDFNSHVRASIDETVWEACYRQELAWWAERTSGASVRTIFFGGGTPSLMSPHLVAAILQTVSDVWPLAEDVEISLEANPNSVEAARFSDLKHAGIQRVSLGVQSFREEALRFLGRGHSVEEATQALKILQKTFDRYSFDLIYTRPQQTLQDWRDELQEALSWSSGHISLYQLTLEEGTPFLQRHQRGDWALPDEEISAQFYEETQLLTRRHGLKAYEISNYARPGHECRHNVAYWQGQDYLGIGPGAHGRWKEHDGVYAIHNLKVPERWVCQVQEQGCGIHERVALTLLEHAEEALMMGLRVVSGIDRVGFRARVGIDPLALLNPEKVQALCAEGLMDVTSTHLRATSQGRQRLNAVLAYLMPLKL